MLFGSWVDEGAVEDLARAMLEAHLCAPYPTIPRDLAPDIAFELLMLMRAYGWRMLRVGVPRDLGAAANDRA